MVWERRLHTVPLSGALREDGRSGDPNDPIMPVVPLGALSIPRPWLRSNPSKPTGSVLDIDEADIPEGGLSWNTLSLDFDAATCVIDMQAPTEVHDALDAALERETSEAFVAASASIR